MFDVVSQDFVVLSHVNFIFTLLYGARDQFKTKTFTEMCFSCTNEICHVQYRLRHILLDMLKKHNMKKKVIRCEIQDLSSKMIGLFMYYVYKIMFLFVAENFTIFIKQNLFFYLQKYCALRKSNHNFFATLYNKIKRLVMYYIL